MHSNESSMMSGSNSPEQGHQVENPLAEGGEDRVSQADGEANETLASWVDMLRERGRWAGDGSGLPILPATATDSEREESSDLLNAARRFHRGDLVGVTDLQPPGDEFVPALLFPFRDQSAIRHDYPVFLFPPHGIAGNRLVAPLSEVLKESARSFAPTENEARILKDNFSRLERHVQQALAATVAPADVTESVTNAGRSLVKELSLGEENSQQLGADLEKLVRALPDGGRLVALGEHTPLFLFMHAAGQRASVRRSQLRKDLGQLRNKLQDLLRIGREKEAEGRRPEALRQAVGSTGTTHLDLEALARVVGQPRGVEPMDPKRRQRIEHVIKTLQNYLSQNEAPLVTVVHSDELPSSWKIGPADWRQADKTELCGTACKVFDEQASRYAQLFGAARAGRLELAGTYDPPRHDPLLEAFGWEAFTREELMSLPPIAVLESAEHLAGSGMLDLSRLLLSSRPLEVIVPVQPATNPGHRLDENPLAGYRFELAYLGVSHREALVNQSSAARPEHLTKGFLLSLDAATASLHVVASGLTTEGRTPGLGAWLHAGAALESRAHPFFHYNPEAGATWARRFDFDGNPHAESDWPLYELPCRSANGEEKSLSLAFTFADFALLEKCYRDHFRTTPPGLDSNDLIGIDEYLTLPPQEAADRIPFIWAADGKGKLHRLLISRKLAFACRDRLDYWRTLQELAGVRNEHVREAIGRERERLEAKFAAERERLKEAHAVEVEQARNEAAGQAMQRLAQTLLNTDVASLAVAPARGAPSASAAAAAVPGEPAASAEGAPAPAIVAPAEAEEEEAGPEEPWIDAILCTSCNDCLGINAQLFVYNSNKQAMIGDPRAGTFAQLVQAAEKCPAKCIHPGKPLNPNEPNLDQLIERAKPFN